MNKQQLWEMAVKIRKTDRKPVGSGVIAKIEGAVYVISAAHVAEKVKDQGGIIDGFISVQTQEQIEIPFEKESVSIHSNYGKEGYGKDYDIAIIDISTFQFPDTMNMYEIEVGGCKIDEEYLMRGYPQIMGNDENDLGFSGKDLKCKSQSFSLNRHRFQIELLNAQIDRTVRSDELKGLSGSGIFKEDEGRTILVGVLARGQGHGAFDTVNCYSPLSLEEVLPITFDRELNAPYDFLSFVDSVYRDLRDGSKKDIICELVREITETKAITPRSLLRNRHEVHSTLYCQEGECAIKCGHRWINRLKLLTYLNAADRTIVDFSYPVIRIDDKAIKIGFLCGEGAADQSNINTIVSDLYQAERLGLNAYEDDTTLIWSSNLAKPDDPISQEVYAGIVKDITYFIENEEGTDVILGNSPHNKYDIIHISALDKKVHNLKDDATEENISVCIKGVIRDAREVS